MEKERAERTFDNDDPFNKLGQILNELPGAKKELGAKIIELRRQLHLVQEEVREKLGIEPCILARKNISSEEKPEDYFEKYGKVGIWFHPKGRLISAFAFENDLKGAKDEHAKYYVSSDVDEVNSWLRGIEDKFKLQLFILHSDGRCTLWTPTWAKEGRDLKRDEVGLVPELEEQEKPVQISRFVDALKSHLEQITIIAEISDQQITSANEVLANFAP